MARIIDTDNKNLIGNKVKLLRKKKHMSQQQLSDKLETLAIYICRGSISRIEDGSRTVTDIELYGLSQVLATPIEPQHKNYFKTKKTEHIIFHMLRLFTYCFLFYSTFPFVITSSFSLTLLSGISFSSSLGVFRNFLIANIIAIPMIVNRFSTALVSSTTI